MAEVLAPPDVEAAVVSVLSGVPGVVVGTRYRDGASGSIRVSATGGGRPVDVVVAAPTVLVECWHADEVEARRIAGVAHATLSGAGGSVVGDVVIYRVSSTLPNNFPDVNRPGMERFQFVATVHSRMIPMEV